MNQPQKNQKNRSEEFVTRPLICSRCKGTAFRKYGKNPTGSQIYRCEKCLRTLTPHTNIRKPDIVVNPQAEYLKDCWDTRALGLKGVGDSSYKINFKPILKIGYGKHRKPIVKSV